MKHRDVVLDLAARVPAWLRALRARLLLEQYAESLGVQEVECPACGGNGWFDRRRLTSCPICRGFREVPVSLAEWYEGELLRSDRRRRGASLRCGAPVAEADGPRYGLCAAVTHRVSEADLEARVHLS